MLHGAGICGNFAAVNARVVIVLGLLASCAGSAGCAGPTVPAPAPEAPVAASPASAPAPAPVPGLPVTTQVDVELSEPGVAVVHGARVAFDGIEEGLAWPSLAKALPHPKSGDVLTLQIARGLPTIHLLRAAWTLRQADLHLQSLDANGTLHAVELKARRDGPVLPGCHLAVFLRPDGSLRVASPGGPVVITGSDPGAILARSLEAERAKCPIKYIAFGAESDTAPWGPTFDVILAVDAAKSAGDARYVLGQAMHAPG